MRLRSKCECLVIFSLLDLWELELGGGGGCKAKWPVGLLRGPPQLTSYGLSRPEGLAHWYFMAPPL